MSALRRKGVIVGVTGAALLIALFVSRLDWAEFREAIGGLRWQWITLACAGVLASITVRAARWLAISGDRAAGLPPYWNATVVGYVGNALYPGRAGDVLRIAALHRAGRLPPGGALASALMDRLADVVMLSAAALYTALFVARNSLGAGVIASVVGMAVALLAAFVAVVVLDARIHPLVVRACARLPGLWSDRLPRWYGQAVIACLALARPKRLAATVALTGLAFLLDYAALWLTLHAFGWQLPMQAAVMIGVFLAIGSLLPAAPGYVGIYQVACVLALKWYGVGESAALAYSVVAQGATLLVIFGAGAAVALRYGLHWNSANRPGA